MESPWAIKEVIEVFEKVQGSMGGATGIIVNVTGVPRII